MTRTFTRARALSSAGLACAFAATVSCTTDQTGEPVAVASAPLVIGTDSPTTVATPIGLALEVDNGRGVPLRVRAGQTFFLDVIDVRASIRASVDEGVAGLDREGAFAALDWRGVALEDEEPILLPNPDGTFVRRRFYRGAAWMERPSQIVVQQVDASGRPTSRAIVARVGTDDARRESDTFFVRRMRAIQWAFDCETGHACAGATQFEEEGLVEVRNAMRPTDFFVMAPGTARLVVSWTGLAGSSWSIPVEQVAVPEWDYGFRIDVEPLTHAGPDGAYPPGSEVSFRVTLRDGSGRRLHPEGGLPTYHEVLAGHPAGITYYRAFGFIDPSATYWRRKHRERMLMAQIIGPAQAIQPIRSIVDIGAFLTEDDTQVVGTPERDGVFAEFQTIPPANDLFGGAFDPTHAGWDAPVSDVVTFHLPEDAEPGTYLVTLKGRRVYLGQDIPRSTTIEIQVGTPHHTEAVMGTGPCTSCHSGGGDLALVLHANARRDACAGCHVPLGFELEGPIFVRTHFLHSRSDRFGQPLEQCSSCHITPESIERTSQAACLSCHRSYPDDHVAAFGAIESAYYGGGRGSFQQCTDSCHVQHPDSGL